MRNTWFMVLGAVLVVGSFLWGAQQNQSKQATETMLHNQYQRAFYRVNTHVQNVEVLLSKTLVGQESDFDANLFMHIWQEANAAQDNLSQIPVPNMVMNRTIQYLNQVSDYANTLAEQTLKGQTKTEEQWHTLRTLYQQAGDLNLELKKMQQQIADNNLTLGEFLTNTKKVVGSHAIDLAEEQLKDLDQKMQQFPVLIYDGPFSDHLRGKKALGLTGKMVEPSEARTIALQSVDGYDKKSLVVQDMQVLNGLIPTYQMNISPKDIQDEQIAVGVSKQGGKIIWMLNGRNVGKEKISIALAQKKAKHYLKQMGFENIELSYHEKENKTVVFNFVGKQDGCIMYGDMIKISVALDDGQIIGFEASNYWDSYRARKLPKPVLSKNQAKQKLSPHLSNVSSGRLALIPVSPDKEVLTYEFRGELAEDVFLIYINATNGREEQLLRLLHTAEGVLTL